MKSTFAKVAIGFVIGATTVGGIATANINCGNSVTTACVDKKTGALFASTGSCAKNRTPVSLGGTPGSINGVVNQVSPAVVTVRITSANGGGTGSGSIFKTDANSSWIVTNNHVIDGANSIKVELDSGEEISATLVGKDSSYDIAVIKVNKGNLPTLTFGD